MERIVRLTESDLKRIVKRIINEDFSNQMSYGALGFAGNPAENVRLYIKDNPGRVVYAFIKKDGDEYYGQVGYEINFEGTNESRMITNDYSGPEQTPDGWVKMESSDDVDFYRFFVERAFKLSEIKLQYLSHKM